MKNFFAGLKKFQSTPSPRRETRSSGDRLISKDISIHSLPKEGDRTYSLFYFIVPFQSTPSPRRETPFLMIAAA